MPVMKVGPGRALLYSGVEGISYLLRDDFTDTLGAGAVNGTPAVPGPGTRVVVDTGNTLSLAGGNMVMARTANFDPGLWLDGVARTAGRLMVSHCNFGNINNRLQVGWDSTQNGQADPEFLRSLGVGLQWVNSALRLAPMIAARDYYFAIVLKTTGAYYFIKESTAYPNWVLLFMSTADATTPLYPTVGAHNAWGAGNNTHTLLRVPEDLWLPTPLMYNTFTGPNGTSLDAVASDATGPDGQVTPTEMCTEQAGNWDIQANRANPDGAGIATWGVGKADVVIDCVVNGGAAGQPGIVLRYTDANNYWYLQADRAANQLELHEMNGGVDTVRANVAAVINDNTDYTLTAVAHGQRITGCINKGSAIVYTLAALNEGVTVHGLWSDNTVCQFDNFLCFSRNGSYELDDFIL